MYICTFHLYTLGKTDSYTNELELLPCKIRLDCEDHLNYYYYMNVWTETITNSDVIAQRWKSSE